MEIPTNLRKKFGIQNIFLNLVCVLFIFFVTMTPSRPLKLRIIGLNGDKKLLNLVLHDIQVDIQGLRLIALGKTLIILNIMKLTNSITSADQPNH